MAKDNLVTKDTITAKDVEDIVKARKQPMGLPPKGGMPEEDDMGPLPPNPNKAKGIEVKLGPSSRSKATDLNPVAKKKGGSVKSCGCKKMAKGGSVSSASKRADGCATKGKTKGRLI